MLRRTTIRTRVLFGLALPAFALVLVVALNLRRTLGLGLVVAAVITLAIGIALAIARSIARPLTLLAEQAADANLLQSVDDPIVVDEFLPPRVIELDYGGEIGRLADAIAAGRERALQTVVDQRRQHKTLKEMAAGSAERTSGVLTTALIQIDELSRRELDPITSTSLASVQRMVARADRHTSGVLVLLGHDSPKDQRDTAVAEVVWAACLAVDAADRLDLVSLADAYVRSDAVSDLAHLLAEVLENAAHATGDTSRVSVLGESTDDGYLVSVVDHGSGMDSIVLEESNRRVSRAVPSELVPARALGLDVVGRLARRQGILVRLGESSDGGIVVRVEIPTSVLTEAPIVEAAAAAAEGEAPVELDLVEEHAIDAVVDAATPEITPEIHPEFAPEVHPEFAAEDVDQQVDARDDGEGEPIEVEIIAPAPAGYLLGNSTETPSIVIEPLPYVVKVNRPHDELLPSGPRKKRWAAALAKVGQ